MSIWLEFRQRPWWRKTLDVMLVLFAAAGIAIMAAWGLYQLGVTNNRGAVDKNYRYLMSVGELEAMHRSQNLTDTAATWSEQYARLAVLARFYPDNARMMLDAALRSDDPTLIDRMMAAASLYFSGDTLIQLDERIRQLMNEVPQQRLPHIVPWMASDEWQTLKQAILKDSAIITEAGRLTGVEPRLIVGCLIGEQIRLFNSNREKYKQYIGPMKILSVQSQFSYGVNGIKEHTAIAVEQHLTDPTSEFYMGSAYEHLLDFVSDDHATERYNRLVDYRNHLYSYIYTGCILHQTMLQWQRAGFDISDRPDILFTLFNLGFAHSVPKANPMPGGSTLNVDGRDYTFGAIGFDFYYSGELSAAFPCHSMRFASAPKPLTQEDISRLQGSTSNCSRPQRGSEYITSQTPAQTTPTSEEPDPFGIDHSTVQPTDHTAQ